MTEPVRFFSINQNFNWGMRGSVPLYSFMSSNTPDLPVTLVRFINVALDSLTNSKANTF